MAAQGHTHTHTLTGHTDMKTQKGYSRGVSIKLWRRAELEFNNRLLHFLQKATTDTPPGHSARWWLPRKSSMHRATATRWRHWTHGPGAMAPTGWPLSLPPRSATPSSRWTYRAANRNGPPGAARCSSSSALSAIRWAWVISGDFPTCASRMAAVSIPRFQVPGGDFDRSYYHPTIRCHLVS